MRIVHAHVKEPQNSKEHRALAASLVHDLGHGPFSHAFEDVGRRLGLKLADHEHMSDSLIRGGEVAEILNGLGSGFANDVADIIKKDGVRTVHHAVVSSQFDADRLDYMRRDRMMSGTQHSAIDFPWLLANLEVGEVSIGVDDKAVGKVETFVLGPKAVHAAEAYVLGLFQLYPTVYFHKTTRGAEKLFAELLVRVVSLVRESKILATGLADNHPLVRFAQKPDDIESALLLDDAVVWGALSLMSDATDAIVAEFARRLRDRQLFRCWDVRVAVADALDPKSHNTDEIIEKIDKCCASIRVKLGEWISEHGNARPRMLLDTEERSPYKPIERSKGPLDQINIRTTSGALVDLKERSSVVAALKVFKLSRVYVDRSDTQALDAIARTVKAEIDACH
jgi:hypothetical protein